MTTAGLGLSERIAALRDEVMRRRGSFVEGRNPFLRDVALWRAARGGRSRVQVRAATLRELVAAAPIEIRPRWHLAGEHLVAGQGCRFGFAEADARPDEAALRRIAEFGLADEEVDEVRRAVRNWLARPEGPVGDPGYQAVGSVSEANAAGFGEQHRPDSRMVFWVPRWIENHSIRDYAKVLRVGFLGIREEVEGRLAAACIADADFPRQENFWRAALDICDAGILLGRRYAEHAERMAGETAEPDEKDRLLRIAGTCRRVPGAGARTFFEAVQSLWLCHVLTCGEDGINANSIGRLDQILWPYYRADVEAGALTRQQAVEVMEELACKLYLEYDVQAIVLGGLDRDGRDAANDLSYVILAATRNVEFVRDLSLRLHRNSPDAFVDLAAEMIARGGGIPFLFNDECFVKALSDRGIALADARDYAPIGCIELTVPGRASPHAVAGWFNAAKCLELALFGGRDVRSGEQLGPPTGLLTDFACFDELFEAYRRQVEWFAERMVYHCNRSELAQRERGPLPCWSVLTDDCIARGRDITDGGAVYNYHSVCFMGVPNTADSLIAVKRLVFEAGQVGAGELLDALRRNFDGCEAIRQCLLRRAPKYGNDDPEVDNLARRVAEHFIDVMDRMRSALGGRYFVHLFTFLMHIPFGKAVGATPDGRLAGDLLAYSLSAHQGRDERGVTATLNSLAKLPHDRAAGASAAIVEVDPSLVAGAAGVRRLAQLIRGAVEMGVGQLQWNVVTVERLKQAQEDPERYGNIAVRVAGFSQMFKLINKELQDHIIARTKHRW